MRDIKFKGKRVSYGGEWVFGFYNYMGINRRGGSMEFAHVILDTSHPDPEGLKQFEVIPETVGQYTGKKDINNTEIYEGDIVKNSGGLIGTVIFENFAWYMKWENSEGRYPLGQKVEIIGNIHDCAKD